MRPIITVCTFLTLLTLVPDLRAQDFGDAPEIIFGCQAEVTCDELVVYPTLPGTLNAAPGRDAPFHFPRPPGTDLWLGSPPTVELAPELACCDWISAALPTDCDDDDGAFVLGLGPTPGTASLFLSGIFAGPDANCLERIAAPFGPSPLGPSGECWGVWCVEASAGPGAPGPLALNLVVDWDLSGDFGDFLFEWAIVDTPLVGPGSSAFYVSAPFPVLTAGPDPAVPGGWAVGPFWTRAMVSSELLGPKFPIMDWDGSGLVGGYIGGETEDWVVLCDPSASFTDCNHNGRPDAVDIWSGTSHDQDHDGVPDECPGKVRRRLIPPRPL